MVERDEGLHIAGTANTVNDEWDAAWDSDQEDSPSKEAKPLAAIAPAGEVSGSSPERNRGSMEEERRHSSLSTPAPLEPSEDDDPTEAWGWGDDDAAEEAVVDPDEPEPPATLYPERRQVTLSEKYWTSSSPQPILQAVIGVLNDGATLTQPEFVLTCVLVMVIAN
jgi:centromere/kinetochore protein ZW10